ncbi:MAG: hypothetical protein RLZ12_528 [Bacillota bacterium]
MTSRQQIKKTAKNLVSRNLGLAILSTLTLVLFYTIIRSLNPPLLNYTTTTVHHSLTSDIPRAGYHYTFSLLPLLLYILSGPIKIGIYNVFLKFTKDDADVSFKSVFSFFGNGSLFFLSLSWYIVYSLLLFLWSLLLVIPGIIKTYSYAMAPYLLIENTKLGVLEAITKSRRIMQGRKFDLFILDLSFIGWYLLCVPTLGLAYFWVWPYHQTSRALFYKSLVAEKDNTLTITN